MIGSERPESRLMRRADRACDEEWIRNFLTGAPFLFISISAENEPFVTCTSFWYDETTHDIYLHTSPQAQLNSMAASTKTVSFMTAEVGRMLPSKTAMGFSNEFASVIGSGRLEIVSDSDTMRHGLNGMISKYFPNLQSERDFRPVTDAELKATAVYHIRIESWAGKRKQVEDDFPGALPYHWSCFRSGPGSE